MWRPSACGRRGSWAGGDVAAWWRWRETGRSAREENQCRLALSGGLHALLTSQDSESNQPGRSTRIACLFEALVSRWIRLVSRWIRLASTNQERSTRIVCFFQALVSRWIGLCEPLDQVLCTNRFYVPTSSKAIYGHCRFKMQFH